jgi:hypothetical protein
LAADSFGCLIEFHAALAQSHSCAPSTSELNC